MLFTVFLMPTIRYLMVIKWRMQSSYTNYVHMIFSSYDNAKHIGYLLTQIGHMCKEDNDVQYFLVL
jgi:hypothetical protein